MLSYGADLLLEGGDARLDALERIYDGLYVLLLSFAFGAVPFAYFYVEEDDSDIGGERSRAAKALGALRCTLVVVSALVLLLLFPNRLSLIASRVSPADTIAGAVLHGHLCFAPPLLVFLELRLIRKVGFFELWRNFRVWSEQGRGHDCGCARQLGRQRRRGGKRGEHADQARWGGEIPLDQ